MFLAIVDHRFVPRGPPDVAYFFAIHLLIGIGVDRGIHVLHHARECGESPLDFKSTRNAVTLPPARPKSDSARYRSPDIAASRAWGDHGHRKPRLHDGDRGAASRPADDGRNRRNAERA
ncbi:MAG: hypothetical protein CMJ27_06200 [Phycisphaerae bacterium]|nr:hypothetical protein [Phycisphaerae bacterium]OUX01706.1 MAG: hypothetical protein CBD91_04010 [Phycisphaeraceae bacterium TMED231]